MAGYGSNPMAGNPVQPGSNVGWAGQTTGNLFGGSGLGGFLGSVFGYGPSGATALQQLEDQGVQDQYATIDQTQGNAARAQQEANVANLQAEAAGQGPSAAQAQLASGINSAEANQLAASGAGGYGGAPGQAIKRAATVGSAAQANAAGQAAGLKANEMLAGQQGLTGALSGVRQQDLAAATAQAQLQQSGMNQYQSELAGLYGQEQGQQAQGGLALQKSLLGGIGGAIGLGAMARGGVRHMDAGGMDLGIGTPAPVAFHPYSDNTDYSVHFKPKQQQTQAPSKQDVAAADTANTQNYDQAWDDYSGLPTSGAPVVLAGQARGGLGHHDRGVAADELTFLGEHAPEVLVHGNRATLADHPVLTMLRGGDVVVPLERGSAPYRPGPLPHQVTPPPSRPAPAHVRVASRAASDLRGSTAPAPRQPGVTPLSPRSRPAIENALRRSGVKARF